MGFFADIDNTRAFQTAEQDTLSAVGRVMRAVDQLTSAVNGLDVRGDFADTWRRATTTYNTTSQECKRNCEQLALAVSTHGRNTDTSNQSSSESYRALAAAAEGIV